MFQSITAAISNTYNSAKQLGHDYVVQPIYNCANFLVRTKDASIAKAAEVRDATMAKGRAGVEWSKATAQSVKNGAVNRYQQGRNFTANQYAQGRNFTVGKYHQIKNFFQNHSNRYWVYPTALAASIMMPWVTEYVTVGLMAWESKNFVQHLFTKASEGVSTLGNKTIEGLNRINPLAVYHRYRGAQPVAENTANAGPVRRRSPRLVQRQEQNVAQPVAQTPKSGAQARRRQNAVATPITVTAADAPNEVISQPVQRGLERTVIYSPTRQSSTTTTQAQSVVQSMEAPVRVEPIVQQALAQQPGRNKRNRVDAQVAADLPSPDAKRNKRSGKRGNEVVAEQGAPAQNKKHRKR